jgi:hypothetical protein
MRTRKLLLSVVTVIGPVAFLLAAPPGSATGPGKPHLPSQETPVGDPTKKMFPLPDLVIVEITKGPGARAHIKNQGKGPAGSCMLTVMCSLGFVQSGAEWQVPALKAGGDTWISLGKCNPVGGTIDSDNAVKESSESNNSYKVKG